MSVACTNMGVSSTFGSFSFFLSFFFFSFLLDKSFLKIRDFFFLGNLRKSPKLGEQFLFGIFFDLGILSYLLGIGSCLFVIVYVHCKTFI